MSNRRPHLTRWLLVLAAIVLLASLAAIRQSWNSCSANECLLGSYFMTTGHQRVLITLSQDQSWQYSSGGANYSGKWTAATEEAGLVRVVFDEFPTNLPSDMSSRPILGVLAPLFESYGSGMRACLDGGRRCLVKE